MDTTQFLLKMGHQVSKFGCMNKIKKVNKKMIFKKITAITPSQRNLIKLKKLNHIIKSPLLKAQFIHKYKISGRIQNLSGRLSMSRFLSLVKKSINES